MRSKSEMKRDDIIGMAWDACIIDLFNEATEELERFAALVAAAEREKIAQSWDALHDKYMADPLRRQMMLSYEMVANLIRGKE